MISHYNSEWGNYGFAVRSHIIIVEDASTTKRNGEGDGCNLPLTRVDGRGGRDLFLKNLVLIEAVLRPKTSVQTYHLRPLSVQCQPITRRKLDVLVPPEKYSIRVYIGQALIVIWTNMIRALVLCG